jgi:hypothetical protein
MTRAIAVGAAILTLLLLGCDKPTPLPEDVARTIQTPEGNEVSVTCPPSFEEAIGPTKLAEILSRPGFPQPEPGDIPPDAFARPGSLCTLLPPDPVSGESITFCPSLTNADPAAAGETEGQWEEYYAQMGRLCRVSVSLYGPDHPWEMNVDMELYATTPGAREAFRPKAGQGEPDDDSLLVDRDLLLSLGDERRFYRIMGYIDGEVIDQDIYVLQFRRRNIATELSLSYIGTSPTGKGSPDPVLEYAAQLDRNIEAAAEEQLGPEH